MKVNYQRVLDETLNGIRAGGAAPRLLLHSCCGPCSSYVLEYLASVFKITVLYFNPNIYPESEFKKRAASQEKLVSSLTFENPVRLLTAEYRGRSSTAPPPAQRTPPRAGSGASDALRCVWRRRRGGPGRRALTTLRRRCPSAPARTPRP
jgi:hypothetical protein